MSKKAYNKPPLTYQEQVALWNKRGLKAPDTHRAIRYLNHISYYRLSAYAIPFQKQKDKFDANTEFEDVLQLYLFDRELRILIFDAIERIEVSIRTQLIYQMAHRYGSHWHEDPRLYAAPYRDEKGFEINTYKSIQSFLKRQYNSDKPEVFVNHYFDRYDTPPTPPSWMALELLTLGQISRLYSDLAKNTDKAEIANYFGVHFTVFESWLHALTYCRNLCAHHSRFWNREFHIQPKIPKKTKFNWVDPHFSINNRSFYYISIIKYLLNIVNPHNSLQAKLESLLKKYPKTEIRYMGIPSDDNEEPLAWHEQPLWKI